MNESVVTRLLLVLCFSFALLLSYSSVITFSFANEDGSKDFQGELLVIPNKHFSEVGITSNIFFHGDVVEFSGKSYTYDGAYWTMPISNFIFDIEINGPGGETISQSIHITDNGGNLHFSLQITEDFEFGRYHLNYTMSKEGYAKRVTYGENTESLIFYVIRSEDTIQAAAGYDFKLSVRDNKPLYGTNPVIRGVLCPIPPNMAATGFIDPTTGVKLDGRGIIFVTIITDPDGIQKTQGVSQTKLSCIDDNLYVASYDFSKNGTWTITSKARWADENGIIFETKSDSLTFEVKEPTITAENAIGEWETAYMVGKFGKYGTVISSNPEQPDKIFKVDYRVSNGTINDFSATTPLTIEAKVGNITDNNNNGLLEIKFPRNYPYTDAPIGTSYGPDFAFFGGDPNEKYGEPTNIESITTDCFFVFSIPFTSDLKFTMVGTSLLTDIELYGDRVPDSCIADTIVSNVITMKDGTISPYQQIKAGVAANDVSCKEGFDLILNPKGKAYCATPSIVELLQERWYNHRDSTGTKEALDSLEQKSLNYVLNTFSINHEIDKDVVKILSSGFREFYGHEIFYAEIQLLEDGKEGTFFYNPKTDSFTTKPPSFEELTGVTNMDRGLWTTLQTAKGDEMLQLIIHIGNLPKDEKQQDAIVQDVIKQIEQLDSEGYSIQMKRPYHTGSTEVRIDATAQAWTVKHLLKISGVTKIEQETFATGS